MEKAVTLSKLASSVFYPTSSTTDISSSSFTSPRAAMSGRPTSTSDTGMTSVIYNARLLKQSNEIGPLHELDFALLADVEEDRIGRGVATAAAIEKDRNNKKTAEDFLLMVRFLDLINQIKLYLILLLVIVIIYILYI